MEMKLAQARVSQGVGGAGNIGSSGAVAGGSRVLVLPRPRQGKDQLCYYILYCTGKYRFFDFKDGHVNGNIFRYTLRIRI